jgi:hypothetical protein
LIAANLLEDPHDRASAQANFPRFSQQRQHQELVPRKKTLHFRFPVR